MISLHEMNWKKSVEKIISFPNIYNLNITLSHKKSAEISLLRGFAAFVDESLSFFASILLTFFMI